MANRRPNIQHLALLIVLLITSTVASADAQQASLTGRVVDQSGAAAPGATVTVSNVETGRQSVVTTNAEGYYSIPLLPPGRYTLAVDLSGFRPQTKSGITLEVQQAARFDFTLEVGALSESVDVRTPLVDAQTSSLGHVIDNARIRELPLNGRNPLELFAVDARRHTARDGVSRYSEFQPDQYEHQRRAGRHQRDAARRRLHLAARTE
jgi:hypothetical protein